MRTKEKIEALESTIESLLQKNNSLEKENEQLKNMLNPYITIASCNTIKI